MENRIKEYILKSGRMQSEIAQELGISTVGLSQLVNTKMPKVETIEKIAAAVGVPAWAMILTDTEIDEIRKGIHLQTNVFRCPSCGASLKVVPADDCECGDNSAASEK